MYQTKLYVPTEKDIPSSATIRSHQLLIQSGFIYQHASGLYTYLPLATKIIENIKAIIDEEIGSIGANKVIFPMLEPHELWEISKRWDAYGAELFKVRDRHDNDFALSPTHEEIATDLLRNKLNSYKKYPLNIYQINTKMRDEIRPRFGLIRAREFIMMDGYSFHTDNESLMQTYNEYYQAYTRILNRIGIEFRVVKADNGQMGGTNSHEFMALAGCGEDTICYEENSDLAYNLEVAPIHTKYEFALDAQLDTELVETKNIRKIEELSSFFKLEPEHFIKSVVYKVQEKIIICFVQGNREIEETKVNNLLKLGDIMPATDEELKEYGLIAGYIGVNDLPQNENIIVYYDQELKYRVNLITGANKRDYHLKNVTLSSELNYVDIRQAVEGDLIQDDGEPIKLAKGIEIGHIFALGNRYTELFKMTYTDVNQKEQIPLMGSYGIGVSRMLSAIVEQNNDEYGMIWDQPINPFDVHIIVLDYNKDDEQKEYADNLKLELENHKIKVLVDDRQERPGFKFKDADLIGLPLQIIVGKSLTKGEVELKIRRKNEKEIVGKDEIVDKLLNTFFRSTNK